MDDPEHNGRQWIPKNLSYESNYHQQYYYPTLVYNRLLNNMEDSNQPTQIASAAKSSSEGTSDSDIGNGYNRFSDADSVTYSEDYTTMTDDGESEIDFRSPSSPASNDVAYSDVSSLSTIGNGDADCDHEGDAEFPKNFSYPTTGELGIGDRQSPNDLSLTITDQGELADPVPSPTEDHQTCKIFKDDKPIENGIIEAGKNDPIKSEPRFYEDREFDFLDTTPKVQRSTSLKTYKTPPGTPHRKKAVRFADALGLDLESVRHVLNMESPPKIPTSALRDLRVGLEEEHKIEGSRYMTACFTQPGSDVNFISRVLNENVVLENCIVDDRAMTITGTVRVHNVSYHKLVIVRYTTNSWMTHRDVHTNYVPQSSDGKTDRFSFTIHAPYTFSVGSRLDFCIMCTMNGNTFWDNNHGRNYCIECYARALPTRDDSPSWTHFL